MSAPNDIRKFSEKWLDMFDWFEANPDTELTVTAETEKRANNLRFEFYKARRAMQREDELRKLYTNVDRREVILQGKNVIFRPKEKAPIAELLQNALERANNGHTTEPTGSNH